MEDVNSMDTNLSANQLAVVFNESNETQSAPEVVNELRHSLFATVIIIIGYTAVALLGICGNSVVVRVLSTKRKKLTVTNIFILNLAVADILVSLFCVSPTLLSNIYVSWILGPILCKAVAYIQGVSVCASVYSLVAISLDRFLGILYPTKIPGGLSKFQARLMVLFIWIFASVITLPWLIVFQLESPDQDHQEYCVESWTQPVNNQLFFFFGNFILCYFLPLTIILFTNLKIWRHVAKRNESLECSNKDDVQRVHSQTKCGVGKMLFGLTFIFFISWLPLYIISFRLKLGGPLNEQTETIISVAIPFVQWLGALNSCVNPIIYSYHNDKLRTSLKFSFQRVFNRDQIMTTEV